MYSLRLDSSSQTFTAKHGIRYLDDKWEKFHEHTFRVVLILSGPINPIGYLVDFMEVSKILSEILQSLDGKILLSKSEIEQRNLVLNDFLGEELVFLPINYTTAELLAKYIAEEVLHRIRPFFEPTRITVELEESPGCWGIYCSDRKSEIGECSKSFSHLPPTSSLPPPVS